MLLIWWFHGAIDMYLVDYPNSEPKCKISKYFHIAVVMSKFTDIYFTLLPRLNQKFPDIFFCVITLLVVEDKLHNFPKQHVCIFLSIKKNMLFPSMNHFKQNRRLIL